MAALIFNSGMYEERDSKLGFYKYADSDNKVELPKKCITIVNYESYLPFTPKEGFIYEPSPAIQRKGVEVKFNPSRVQDVYNYLTAYQLALDHFDNTEISNKLPKHDYKWLTPELNKFLNGLKINSFELMDHLFIIIKEVYGEINYKSYIYTDPEEGWSKVVIVIYSETKSFEDLMSYQETFFYKAESDAMLLSILPYVIITQE